MTATSSHRFVVGLIGFAVLVFGLMVGKAILLPFVAAIVIWYLIYTLAMSFRQVPMVGKKLPYWMTMMLSFAVIFIALWLFSQLVSSNISQLIAVVPSYHERLIAIFAQIQELLHVKDPMAFDEIFQDLNLTAAMTGLAAAIAELARDAVVILLYVLFLLMEQHLFTSKMRRMIKDPGKYETTRKLIDRISSQIQSYLKIKSLVSLVTALISYAILLMIGVDFAGFWAVLIFFLNFIPTIGSIMATFLPMLLTLVQFDSFTPFFLVAISLISIQFLIGNIIEPKLMGKSFNLSPLVILLSLAFWGTIWGVLGMFLCVPIMVIGIIILSNFESTWPIAVALSENGDIK